jgi:hypothetical protein
MKKLDLHRTRHEDARRKTIHFVEDNWASGEEAEIITGNSYIMKDLVKDILIEYHLNCQEGRKFDTHNQGYIVTWFE